MLSRLFQRSSPNPPSHEALARAEQSLIAETLLLASTHLLVNPNPVGAISHMCASLASATPHIPLIWAWLGDSRNELIKPQIVVSPRLDPSTALSFDRANLSQRASGVRSVSKQATRVFDVSTTSSSPQCRELAARLGVRSALVVPIANGDDDRGLLGLYSTRPKYFDSVSSGLFETIGQWSHSVLTQSRRPADNDTTPHRDAVTGLHSRDYAQRLIDDAWRAPATHDNRGVLMLINIDQLKKINADCGQHVGDLAVAHLARVVEQNLRRTDVIARWRADEFLAWLPAVSGATALATAEQLRASVAGNRPDVLDGWPVGWSVSVGATPVPATDSFVAALDRANRALTAAKYNGQDCVVVARPDA